MSESLILTFAEVVALAGLCNFDRGERVLDLLKVSPDARSDLVRQAGLASLLARDLARANTDGVVLAPGPKLVVDVVSALGRGFELGIVGREGGDGMIVLAAAGDRMVVSPRQYGCYALASLEPEGDLARQLAEIVEHLLAAEADAVAAIVALTPDPDPERSVVVGVDQGRWHLSATGPGGHREVGDRSGVIRQLVEQLRHLTTSSPAIG